MGKLTVSKKVKGGIHCPDLRGHYRLNDRVAQRKDQKDRVTVSYSFYGSGKWYSDVAYITRERLGLLISFADKRGLAVDSTYRDLAAGVAFSVPHMTVGPVPDVLDFRG